MDTCTHSTAAAPRATTAKDLEPSVCDLLNLSRLVVTYAEHTATGRHGVCELSKEESEVLMFGIYEVDSRLTKLKSDFYAAIWNKAVSK